LTTTEAAGQIRNEIREENEIGKEFHFELLEDGVRHSLELTFTGFVGAEQIKATFMYKTENFKTYKSDSLSFDVYCVWIADIVDLDSTGYEYNSKVCTAYQNSIQYTFEINESRTDYPSVDMRIFDPKTKSLTEMVLMPKEKE
jgi:hypothetical protein